MVSACKKCPQFYGIGIDRDEGEIEDFYIFDAGE